MSAAWWPDEAEKAPAEALRARTFEWLHERLSGVHPELAAAIRRCVREGPSPKEEDGISGVLAAAAAAELERLASAAQDRAAAVRLLAADAVLTYAFEAAAREGEDPETLADHVGLQGTLGRALLRAVRAGGETA